MNLKKKILNMKSSDELEYLEADEYEKFRNNFYNELLKDNEIKKHICNLYDVDEKVIENVLLINDASPIDDFPEDEM